MLKNYLIRQGMSLVISWVLSTRNNDELTDILASILPRPLAEQLVGLISHYYNYPLQKMDLSIDYSQKP